MRARRPTARRHRRGLGWGLPARIARRRGLAAAREKLDKLAERLARQPEAHRRRTIAIRAAVRYAADLAQERHSA